MSGTDVLIRVVRPSDASAVIDLWAVVFPEYTDPSRPQRDPGAAVARKLSTDDELFWVATLDGRIVGSVMAGYDGHRGWIYSLGVHPEARRQGVASRLLHHAEAALEALGCPKINLQVQAGNAEAIAFWTAAGYVEDRVVSLGRRLGRA